MADTVGVKLLDRVIHGGLVRSVGESITVTAQEAESLIDRGLAEAESAAKRLVRKAKPEAKAPDAAAD